MSPELLVIANSVEARLFTRASDRDPLALVESMTDPAGRRRSSDLGDDRPGHGSSDHRPGGVSFPPRVDPHRKQHRQFAELLAGRIDAMLAAGHCSRVTVFAASPFVGEMKSSLSPPAAKALRAVVDLDLTHVAASQLPTRIDHALRTAGRANLP